MLTKIHLYTLMLAIPFILFADHLGILYFIGKPKTLKASTIQRLHMIIFFLLLIMIGTGVALTLPAWDFYLNDAIFLVKMFFVMVLFINGIFIGRLMESASQRPYAELDKRRKVLLLISGSLSFSGWVASAVIGYFLL